MESKSALGMVRIIFSLLGLFQQFCDLDTTIIQQERLGQVKELI